MTKQTVFFLAEDDEDDQLLFREAIAAVDPAISCMVAKNGKEALQILQSDLLISPDCILLDLNMPLMNGIDCLRAIKKEPQLLSIPAVLYSTTVTPQMESEAKRLGAMHIFKKPDNYHGLIEQIRLILAGLDGQVPKQ